LVSVIVLFPKLENAKYIKNILVRNGIEVTAVHTSGAQVILTTDSLEEGLVICGYRFRDMMYDELKEYLPDGFEMLLITSKAHWAECENENIAKLAMPVKAFELMNAVNERLDLLEQRRRKRKQKPRVRSEEERRVIDQAKELLRTSKGMTEEEAHRYLQKHSMDSGTNLVEMSRMVLQMNQSRSDLGQKG
jgi:response regulator NasT